MRARQLVEVARQAAESKMGQDPIILDLGPHSSIASYFLIVHGNSGRHAKTLAEHIMEELRKKSERVWHCEGMRDANWIVLDYGDVVIHVFHHEARKFYNLERLWGGMARAKKSDRS